jgi:hypothetical protein
MRKTNTLRNNENGVPEREMQCSHENELQDMIREIFFSSMEKEIIKRKKGLPM